MKIRRIETETETRLKNSYEDIKKALIGSERYFPTKDVFNAYISGGIEDYVFAYASTKTEVVDSLNLSYRKLADLYDIRIHVVESLMDLLLESAFASSLAWDNEANKLTISEEEALKIIANESEIIFTKKQEEFLKAIERVEKEHKKLYKFSSDPSKFFTVNTREGNFEAQIGWIKHLIK